MARRSENCCLVPTPKQQNHIGGRLPGALLLFRQGSTVPCVPRRVLSNPPSGLPIAGMIPGSAGGRPEQSSLFSTLQGRVGTAKGYRSRFDCMPVRPEYTELKTDVDPNHRPDGGRLTVQPGPRIVSGEKSRGHDHAGW